MFSFGRKKAPLLGIDIGTTGIKLIELAKNTGRTDFPYRLESYAIEPLPPSAVIEKKIAEVETVGEAIQRAVAKSGTKAKNAAVAVSGSAVITKVISLPAGQSDAEIEAQIRLEADQYIPYDLEEVNLDFDIIGPSASGADQIDVLLAASKSENIDERVSALEIAGLTATIVDVEAYVMERACALLLEEEGGEENTDQTVAVVDIGLSATTLQVLHEGHTVYLREQNFGSQQLVDEVQRRYALPRKQAIEQIIDGGLPEKYPIEVLSPYKEALAQQINRALQFFYSSSSFNRVDKIILAGGAASIHSIDELIEERLGIPTMVADPFIHMSFSAKIKEAQKRLIHRDAPALMIATGLALRGFD